jgi:hypothetical protein
MNMFNAKKRAREQADLTPAVPKAAGTGREEAMALIDRGNDKSAKDVRVTSQEPEAQYGVFPFNMVTVGTLVLLPRVLADVIEHNTNQQNMDTCAVIEVWQVINIPPPGPERTFVDMTVE